MIVLSKYVLPMLALEVMCGMESKINFKPICFWLLITILLLFNSISSSSGIPNQEQPSHVSIYGCGELYNLHCEILPDSFASVSIHGIINQVYEVRTDPVAYTNGSHGEALVLHDYQEGPDQDYIPKNGLLNPHEFTVSFWLKAYPSYRFIGQVLSHVNAAHSAGWFFITEINQTASKRTELLRFSVTDNNGTVISPPPAPIYRTNFTHFVGTFDGNFIKFYVNGVLYSSQKYKGNYEPNPNTTVAVGVNSFNYKKTWSGFIDDLRIYNRALNYSDVKRIFDNSSVPKEGLVGYWPFDSNLNDVSGNKNNVRVTGPVVSMAFTPDGRMFFNERTTGKVRIMQNDRVLQKPFVTLPIHVAAEQGLLGLAIDPHFDQNHFVYIYYTPLQNRTGLSYNRLARFTEYANTAQDEKILLDKIPASKDGRHSGGALTFGPDDKLYVSVGFANVYEAPQNKTSLLGKVLRVNRDGTIPSDNPFPGSPVYTIGHRNIYGIAFDNKGNSIVTENGDSVFDEINLLKAGANFGFPTFQPENLPPMLANRSSVLPIRTYWNTLGLAQAIFYTGDKFPLLKNKFLYTAYNTPNLYALELNEQKQADKEWVVILNDTDTVVGPTIALAMAPSGDLYFGGYRIFKLKSLDLEQPRQISYMVRAEASKGLIIKDIQVYPKDKTMVVKVLNNNSSDSFLILRIPKQLLQGISQITMQSTSPGGAAAKLDYTVNMVPRACGICDGVSLVNIHRMPSSEYRIIINASQVLARR
jgi:glucose/arabinose dehydrogenase